MPHHRHLDEEELVQSSAEEAESDVVLPSEVSDDFDGVPEVVVTPALLSEVELPREQESDDSDGSLSLPDSQVTLELGPQDNSCCWRNCKQKMMADPAKREETLQFRTYFQSLPKFDQDDFLYDMMMKMSLIPVADSTDGSEERPAQSRIPWTFLGSAVCRKGWKGLVAVGNSRVQRMVQQLKLGHRKAPQDRHSKGRGQNMFITICCSIHLNMPSLDEHIETT